MKEQSEQEIQKTIVDYLRIKGYVTFKHHSTGFTVRNGKVAAFRYSEKGISDIIACSPTGRFTAIEVKRPKGTPSPEQIEFISQVNARGGLGFIAYSFDEVFNKIEALV